MPPGKACRGMNPRARRMPASRLVIAGALALAPVLPFAQTGGDPTTGGSPRRLETHPAERVTVQGIPPERVLLSVSVVDAEGNPVIGLGPTDFIVREEGRIQEILDFGVERDRQDRPLSAILLVDRSESIGRQMSKWKEACTRLLSVLRPADEVQVSVFSEDVEVVQPFTNDPRVVEAAVDDLPQWGAGGTRILPALEDTIVPLRSRRGRKVIFLLTDGLDGGLSRPISSNPRAADLAARAVQGQITIVTILPGPVGEPFTAAQDLALHTGGWWLYSSDDLPALIGRLGERLLQSYYLVYDSIRDPADHDKREIEVSLGRPPAPGTSIATVAGVYGESPLLEHLLEDLEDDAPDLRARAAAWLGTLEDKEAAKPLSRSLEDEDPGVRAAAVMALGRRGDFRAVKAIGRLLADEDEGVREAAVAALGILLGMEPDEKIRGRILDALEEVAPPEPP